MEHTKELLFDTEARQKLYEGVAKIADAATLGPQKNGDTPHLELKDPFINMGAAIAKKSAETMHKKHGDGTATTLLLLKTLIEESLRQLAAGANLTELTQGIEQGAQIVFKELSILSKPMTQPEEILAIATAAALGDREAGSLIAEAIQKVGGLIIVEEGKDKTSSLEMVEGLQIDEGYLSPYFCTDSDRLTIEMHDAALLIINGQLHSIQEIFYLLQPVMSLGRELLIVASDVAADALSTLAINHLRGTLRVCAIKAPSEPLLQDLIAFSSATLISKKLGLKQIQADALGSVKKVIVSKEKTIFLAGPLETNKLRHQKTQFSRGFALLRVGAHLGPELHQKKELFEKSLNSIKVLLEEGFVPGGGVALLRASQALHHLKLKGDKRLGVQIVLQACEAPFRQIVWRNRQDPSLILNDVLSSETYWGFNALTCQVEDLLKCGIVDSFKTVKAALRTALSSAISILLSDVLITPANEGD